MATDAEVFAEFHARITAAQLLAELGLSPYDMRPPAWSEPIPLSEAEKHALALLGATMRLGMNDVLGGKAA